jgi:hypothetical protein
VGRLKTKTHKPSEEEILHVAKSIFEDLLLENHLTHRVGDVKKFIKRWKQRLGDYRDKPKGHPKIRMTDEECRICIEELRHGYEVSGDRLPFASLDHASQMPHLCPMVAGCRMRYRSHRGMWQRLRRYDPDLKCYKTVTKKLILTDKLRKERFHDASFYLAQDDEYLRRIFFIDAKTLFMAPKHGWCIGYKGDPFGLVQCSQAIYYKQDVVKVKFWAMANYYAGVCGCWIAAGTTGKEMKYKVNIF